MNEKPSDFGGLCFLQFNQILPDLMRRVMIVGANGAGKTWVAVNLATALDVPLVHKDALALMKGWQQRPRSEVQTAVLRAASEERWVLEGGPSILALPVLERATLVIWLDMPAPLRAWRVLYRSLRYLGRTRPEHPPGNRDWPGLRQVRFLWRALIRGPAFTAAVEDALSRASVPVVRLQCQADVRRFLARMGKMTHPAG